MNLQRHSGSPEMGWGFLGRHLSKKARGTCPPYASQQFHHWSHLNALQTCVSTQSIRLTGELCAAARRPVSPSSPILRKLHNFFSVSLGTNAPTLQHAGIYGFITYPQNMEAQKDISVHMQPLQMVYFDKFTESVYTHPIRNGNCWRNSDVTTCSRQLALRCSGSPPHAAPFLFAIHMPSPSSPVFPPSFSAYELSVLSSEFPHTHLCASGESGAWQWN